MFETAAIQAQSAQNSISTYVLDRSSVSQNIRPTKFLLPEVGKRSLSTGAVDITFGSNEFTKRKATSPLDTDYRSISSFKSLESWVGRINEVDESKQQFSAMVVSDLHPNTREVADFTFDEISDDDRLLLEPGAMFYWSVGYQINEFGGRTTASVLRFKRLRHWHRRELERAKARSSEYADWFIGGANGLANASSR
jgi:hypothetical protein